MDYNSTATHVIQARFKEAQRDKVKLWIRRRYSKLWAMADWPWKVVSGATLTVSAGDATPTPPTDIHRPRSVYDENGWPLTLMTTEAFDSYGFGQYQNVPHAWKWENGVITLGPTPSISATYSLTYERRIAHRNNSDVITDGSMSLDTDMPVWDNREFDYILVPGAIATGLKEENDPTWQALEDEFGDIFNDMREYYLPSVAVYGNLQYGADNL